MKHRGPDFTRLEVLSKYVVDHIDENSKISNKGIGYSVFL